MKLKKLIYVILGCVSLALGAIGTVLPILPTVPFLLLSAFCFSRSSEKLDAWFKGTKMYKNNLETYVKGEGMSLKSKVKIMSTVTLLMGFGFYMMENVKVGRIVLAIVWILHMVYFTFGVKTYESAK